MDRLLDAGSTGPLYLRLPGIAKLVTDAIAWRQPLEYRLHAYVVMPNHTHLLITPQIALTKIMHSLKRFTAREANRVLSLTGQPFWQDESFDRLVRNEAEFERIVSYIESNPVNAGLALTPQDFPWSSARPIDNRPQDSILDSILPHRRSTLPYPISCSNLDPARTIV
jgi:REP element-mobilizing transposase RayT